MFCQPGPRLGNQGLITLFTMFLTFSNYVLSLGRIVLWLNITEDHGLSYLLTWSDLRVGSCGHDGKKQ